MQLGYLAFSGAYLQKWEKSANQTQIFSKSIGFQNEVVSRVKHLALVPVAAIAGSLDLIAGSLTGVVSIVTLRKFDQLNNQCNHSLLKGGSVLSKTYFHLLKSINPQAPFDEKCNKRDEFLGSYLISYDLLATAQLHSISNNIFKRHVVSRFTYALAAIVSVVKRVVDAMFIVPVTALSFLTFGKFKKINTAAYRLLAVPAGIQEVLYSLSRVINP